MMTKGWGLSVLVGVIVVLAAGTVYSAEKVDNSFGNYMLSSESSYISMELDGAKLSDVLKLLSKKTGLNFVPAESVRNQKVTLYIDNVPLDETLTTLFETHKLSYDFYPNSNIFVVKEKSPDKPDIELRTKVYYLKYARVSSSRLTKVINDFGEGENETTGSNVLTSTSGSSSSSSSDSGSSSDEDSGMKKIIEKVLTKDGKVTEEPRMNALIVTDRPYQFATIDNVVAQLDKQTPKVLIEVEVLDVVKTLADDLGFTYADGLSMSYTPGAYQTHFPWSRKITVSDLATRANEDRGDAGTHGSLGLGNGTDPLMAMKFLQTDSRTKTLARPKILTLSNETAEIKIVTDAVVGLTTNVATGGTSTQSVERQEIGTVLRVTPQVNEITNEITLFVETSVRGIVDSGIQITGMTTGNIQNPTGRQTKTVLRLNNGETLLIGGLISKTETKAKSKVPFLGEVPFLGAAFRNKSEDTEDREMLVFITPRLVADGKSMASTQSFDTRRQARFSSRVSTMRNTLDRFEYMQ